MAELIIELANLDPATVTPNEITRLFAAYGVKTTLADEKRGYADNFKSNGYVIYLGDGTIPESIKAQFREDDVVFVDSESEDFEKIFREQITSVVAFSRALLNMLVDPDKLISIDYLQPWLEKNSKIFAQRDPNSPLGITIKPYFSPNNLTDIIMAREVIAPIIEGHYEDLLYIKKCKQCGKFYYSRDSRKNFCTPKCRSKYNNALQRERSQTTD